MTAVKFKTNSLKRLSATRREVARRPARRPNPPIPLFYSHKSRQHGYQYVPGTIYVAIRTTTAAKEKLEKVNTARQAMIMTMANVAMLYGMYRAAGWHVIIHFSNALFDQPSVRLLSPPVMMVTVDPAWPVEYGVSRFASPSYWRQLDTVLFPCCITFTDSVTMISAKKQLVLRSRRCLTWLSEDTVN